jgi:MarR family transcriptional regulator, 2-MHQ and catechol-resistance regulon repressor
MTDDLLADHRLTAVGLIIEVHGGLRAMIGAQFAQQRLPRVPDFDALIRLARSPGRRLRMCDLAAQMSLSTSGVTRLVDRLERRHLVRREPCPGDRRSSLAVLTDGGAARVTAMLPTLVDAVERWFTGLLNPEQLQATMASLRAVRDAVRPGADAQSGTACYPLTSGHQALTSHQPWVRAVAW